MKNLMLLILNSICGVVELNLTDANTKLELNEAFKLSTDYATYLAFPQEKEIKIQITPEYVLKKLFLDKKEFDFVRNEIEVKVLPFNYVKIDKIKLFAIYDRSFKIGREIMQIFRTDLICNYTGKKYTMKVIFNPDSDKITIEEVNVCNYVINIGLATYFDEKIKGREICIKFIENKKKE